MLKGIIFVIAIIITFDIGKAMIDAWYAEDEAPVAEQQEPLIDKAFDSHTSVQSGSGNSGSANSKWVKPRKWLAKQKEAARSEPENNAPETIQSEKSIPIIIDLSLPAEETTTKPFETQIDGFDSIPNRSVSPSNQKDKKKVSMNAKPIVNFEKGMTEIPRLEGASVGIKVKLD